MSIPSKRAFVGFPPPLLGVKPLRLPILGRGADWLALDKPAEVAMREYAWDAGQPNLDTALNEQLKSGKPELLRLEAEIFGSVYYLDPSISGVGLFAKNRQGLDFLRNQYGSSAMHFRFLFVAPKFLGELEEGFEATAPLLPHNTKPKMIPSTAKGKKSLTLFKRIAESAGGWCLWEAKTHFFRPHQVRAHFALSGASILGDQVYGGVEAPLLRDFVSKKRGAGSGLNVSVYDGLALHLESVDFLEVDDSAVSIHAPLPRTFQVMLKRMDLNLPL